MIFLNDEEIREIFKNHLKIESRVMSIETMFSIRKLNTTTFDPYYQRNYVWDADKATYFLESILLGTEIPPLVMFNNGSTFEVIDGRQRFETIKRFMEGKLPLSSAGFTILQSLAKKHFAELDEDTKGIFLDTKLRVIEFRIVNEPRLDARKEDLIKKEIFRRYNSGITPLKTAEIENAKYIDDDVTGHFKRALRSSKEDYDTILDLFFQERDKDQSDKSIIRERVLKKVRELLVMPTLDITYYAKSSGRKALADRMYEHLSNSAVEEGMISDIYSGFLDKIHFLSQVKDDLDVSNRLIYECLYWAMSILESEAQHSYKNRRDDLRRAFVDFARRNESVFDNTASHFSKSIIDRYSATAEFIKRKFGVNTDVYMETENQSRRGYDNSPQVPLLTKLSELEVLRLNKPEPETTTIEDITNKMKRGRFLVRPAYQRGETINRVKSSALIESILLDIQLPPIFLYKRSDGTFEVIDGQQRLLSILGFIGAEFVDENGDQAFSEKNNYKLTSLRILPELNKQGFRDLTPDQQEKILTFNLSVVNIDSKLNPKFNPIDLFLRLNNKPYPIRENTFEM